MRSFVQLTVIAVLSLGFFSPLSPARAAAHDGQWSVLVTTDKGDCDRGYRYGVNVANGLVRYNGAAAVALNGTVTPNGAVAVHITSSGQGAATGTGRLSASAGSGTWHGSSDKGSCSGHWEAERR